MISTRNAYRIRRGIYCGIRLALFAEGLHEHDRGFLYGKHDPVNYLVSLACRRTWRRYDRHLNEWQARTFSVLTSGYIAGLNSRQMI